MTTLGDRADPGPPVDLAGSLLETQYRIHEDHDPEDGLEQVELVPARDIGDRDFPKYGEYLKVSSRSPVDGTFRGDRYIEMTQGLAATLLELGVEDSWWEVTDHNRGPDDEHVYVVELVDE
jgi:hypothetical protein